MGHKETLFAMRVAIESVFGVPEILPESSVFSRLLLILLQQGGAKAGARQALELLLEKAETPKKIGMLSEEVIIQCIKPAGNAKVKAARIKGLLTFLAVFFEDDTSAEDCTLSFLHKISLDTLREQLLQIRGIGQETADSLLLYGLSLPIFPLSSSIYRIIKRHGFVFEDADYAELQGFFMDAMPADYRQYQQLRELLLIAAARFCKVAAPHCEACPLNVFLEYAPVE